MLEHKDEEADESRHEDMDYAYEKLVTWQAHVVAITNDLISAENEAIDVVIRAALRRTGQLAGSDRTYVFRLRDSNRLDNTHEWCAEGIEPVIDDLQDLPDDLLMDWRGDLEAGRPVYIADVEGLASESVVRDILLAQNIKSLLAVPMLRDKRLKGFVGYDSVRNYRSFQPAEIQLIQSVANAINVATERAVAEIAAEAARAHLERESERLRATLRAIPDLLLELDHNGRFVDCTAGAFTKPFLPIAELMGKLPEDILDAHLAGLVRRIMADVDKHGKSRGREYQLELPEGRRWFQVSASGRYQEQDRGYVFLVRDVTETRNQQRQILRLSKVAELTSNLVIVTDPHDRIEWVNPAFERRSGWVLDEVIGLEPKSFLRASVADRDVRHRISQAISSGEDFQGELLNRSRTGEEYWTSVDITAMRDDADNVTGFVSVQADITSLKRAHKQTVDDLATAIDESSDAVFLSNPCGTLKYANSSARRLFGIAAEKSIDAIYWHEFFPKLAFQVALEQAADSCWHGETIGRVKDGHEVQLEISLTRRNDGSVIAISRDVTERRRSEKERARLREELQLAQRKETIAHLASGVAHDLNNLIAVVDGTVSLLEMRIEHEPTVAVATKRIRGAVQMARELVTNLGRLDRSGDRPSLHDLCILIRQTADLLGVERTVENAVNVCTPEYYCPIWGCETDIQQVIANLAINACDAKADRPNNVLIEVLGCSSFVPERSPDIGHYYPEKSYSSFIISDTGKGVSAADRARLFERYFTTKGKDGTGLGMPIVASILRDNDAVMWFDTKLGKGTIVTVAWPSAAPTRVTMDSVPRKRIRAPEDLSGHRILIVDDFADVAEVLASMVRRTGASAVAVSDPMQAMELINDNAQTWSALITDLDMPRISGIDLARAASQRDSSLPVILVTALPEDVEDHDNLFSDIAGKPIDYLELVQMIQNAMESSS